mmetsp:Transcript_10699/g.12207  ORF Transcript_10699/g.12207 Transcript_10699/m.12207 type:complete len:146 (+) Transcript_10699:74-511(+)
MGCTPQRAIGWHRPMVCRISRSSHPGDFYWGGGVVRDRVWAPKSSSMAPLSRYGRGTLGGISCRKNTPGSHTQSPTNPSRHPPNTHVFKTIIAPPCRVTRKKTPGRIALSLQSKKSHPAHWDGAGVQPPPPPVSSNSEFQEEQST